MNHEARTEKALRLFTWVLVFGAMGAVFELGAAHRAPHELAPCPAACRDADGRCERHRAGECADHADPVASRTALR